MRHTYILSALAALSAVALVSVSPEQVSAAGGGRGAVPSLDAVPQSASPSGKEPAFPGLEKAGTHTVYAGQPEITEPEMQRFISVLPGFRTWVKSRGVSVRPTVTKGKPDFTYPPEVGSWLSGQGWNPDRFFCVFGRTAAGMTIVSEGGSAGAKASGMPSVSVRELDLVRRYLAGLLNAFSEKPAVPAAPAR